MSQVSISAALEVALNAMTPALDTAWCNAAYIPPAVSRPYQVAWMMYGTPVNRELGRRYEENGYLQVDLMYPLQAGSSAAWARGELIRQTFYRGATFSSGGQTVTIMNTPSINNGQVEGTRWKVTVKIPFHAFVD